MDIYVVKSGDNLYAIAQKFSVAMSQLLQDNQLDDPSQLVVGQTLVIRYPKLYHTVQIGDTLQEIAKKYDTTVKELLENNPKLGGWEDLQAGQQLVIFYKETAEFPIYATAYAYTNIDRKLLHQTLPYLTTVTPFTHRFNMEGELSTLNDGYLQWSGEKVGVGAVFHLASVNPDGAFSTALSNAVLSSEELQEKLIGQIEDTLKKKAYVGVDVDFELIDPNLAKAYVAFLSKLKNRMGELPLTVAVAPKTSSEQRGIFYEGHLYNAIGEVADKVLLMTYEWGYAQGEPMAISPIYGVRQVLDYAITEIPREKLLMGINTYGYDWKIPKKLDESAKSISCPQGVTLARDYGAEIFFDQEAQAPYFHYTEKDGQKHSVWFEDARSIQGKLNLVKEYGISGVGYWNLDRPFPQNWILLQSNYKT